jgi:phosphoglycolate phosphatase
MQKFSAVLFDLDGTLVDTAPDLGYALNCVLAENDKPTLSMAQIRPVASHGAAGLIALGFGITPQHDNYPALRDRLLQLYQDNITRESDLFDGMAEVLSQLEQNDITWGVITNKPSFLTEPLLAQLDLTDRSACIVSGDTTPYSKPHPAPMLKGLDDINHAAEDCIYIGDAERDIQAGKAVNMPTVLARYGYLTDEDKQQDWQADAIIDHPSELLAWI